MSDIRELAKEADVKVGMDMTDATEAEMIIRKYVDRDLPEIIRIWNEVVEEGIAFPQEVLLDSERRR
jgi:hypothetical protein